MLEHHADVNAGRDKFVFGFVTSADFTVTPCLLGSKTVHRLDEGGFAGTGRTADHDNLSFLTLVKPGFKDGRLPYTSRHCGCRS